MNFLTDSIRPIYFKYLTAAFGSALRGEAAGNEKKSNEWPPCSARPCWRR